MTSSAQVLHVARKDARLARWPLALYLAGVLLVTANAVLWLGGSGVLWVLALSTFGALLAGMLVHGDSPTRVDAFWATRPLSASAVYGAKLLLCAALVAVPLLGEFVGLRAHDISTAGAGSLLVRPAAAYVALIATAIMVATLTPDVRIFLIAFFALFMAQSIGVNFLPRWLISGRAGALPVPLVYAVAVGGMLLLGLHQYRTRDPRRGLLIGLLLALMMMLIPAGMLRGGPAFPAPPLAAVDTAQLRLEVEPLRDMGDNWLLPLRLSVVGGSPTQRYTFEVTAVWLESDGVRTALPSTGRLGTIDNSRTHGTVGGSSADAPHSAGIIVTPAERAALLRAGARVIVAANMVVGGGVVVADLPLREGAITSSAGTRVRLLDIERTPETLQLRVRHSVVPTYHGEDTYFSRSDESFALTHPQDGDVVPIVAAREQSYAGALVLPASHVAVRTVELHMPQRSPVSAQRDVPSPEWLADARLRLMRWSPLGRYAVRAEAPVPPDGGR